MGLKNRLYLAEQIVKYAKACGKTHILQTLPQDLSKIDTCGLKLAPKLEGDLVQLSLKPKIVKDYRTRQMEDIAKYGEMQVDRIGVTDAMLERFTPHRRLSNKPCTLKNPKEYEYYISKYEETMGAEFLSKDWEKLTSAQKYDFIVKDRYSRLVSNKIMKSIQIEKNEHAFYLDNNGNIVGYGEGITNEVYDISQLLDKRPKYHIHNHPQCGLQDKYEYEYILTKHPEYNLRSPFSGADIALYLKNGQTGYLIDSTGHKYCYRPKTQYCNDYSVAKDAQNFINENWNEMYNNIDRTIFEEKRAELVKMMRYTKSDKDIEIFTQKLEEAKEINFQMRKQNNQDGWLSNLLSSDKISKYGKYTEL